MNKSEPSLAEVREHIGRTGCRVERTERFGLFRKSIIEEYV
jgi:hypothetical protein